MGSASQVPQPFQPVAHIRVLPYLPMACPRFYPVERIRQTLERTPPRPLGDVWSGICRSQREREWLPDAAIPPHTDDRVAQQDQAYISSYLRRKEDLGRR